MRLWPKTLLSRSLLLLIALILASQASTIGAFVVFIQRPRIDDIAAVQAAQIIMIEHLVSALPPAARAEKLAELNGVPDGALSDEVRHASAPLGAATRRYLDRLAERLPANIDVRWVEGPVHRLWVRLPVNGSYCWIALPASRATGGMISWSAAWILLTIAAFPALGAYLIHRRIDGPLQRLSYAAASIERGVLPDSVPVQGPLELATVAEGFNRMVASLGEIEAVRAQMLAGISHDIRTPLTKLRMALAAPETLGASGASAERFVEQIDVIVQQFIDFARGGEGEVQVQGDLNALVEQLAADYAGLGYSFRLELGPLPTFWFRPVGVQRLLLNVMQNAAVYGRTGMFVTTRMHGDFIVVLVGDEGPGVPPAMLTLLKQPFRRGPHPHHGGTGLGLAIADRIARHHGGWVELRLREGGGLLVEAWLRQRI